MAEALTFLAGEIDLAAADSFTSAGLLVGLEITVSGAGDGFRSGLSLVLVPEPEPAFLLGLGLVVLALRARRRLVG